ncbi:hypothetical protein JFV29_23870 [Peribacillus sp. TH16]|nr:hypothetical protein [Peribacillus sp. R9-11]MBK5484879.1 hypothetical protein [Peribacillus sp. TH16]MBK5499937.1 hypothetical protein [Peribacillus sp. TH14]WMX55010.1 hypothetical protein RE409_23650 [Peribacillus sp. R9-11]
MSLAILFVLVMGFINDFDFYFVMFFTLLGVNSVIDGIESYFQKEDKRVYLLNYGFAVIYIILSFQFSG